MRLGAQCHSQESQAAAQRFLCLTLYPEPTDNLDAQQLILSFDRSVRTRSAGPSSQLHHTSAALSDCRDGCRSLLKWLIWVEKPGFFRKIWGWGRGYRLKNQGDEHQQPLGVCWGTVFDWRRAAVCAGFLLSQLKNFDFLGTLGGTQKSGKPESNKKSPTQLQPHCGRSNFPAIDSANSPRCDFSILRAYSD